MKDHFKDFIYQRVRTAKALEVEELLSVFNESLYSEGTVFEERNTVIKNPGFLANGSARSYFINEKGDEITDEVLQSNNFLSDITSIRSNKKSSVIIEVLEESSLLVARMDDVWNMLNHNVTFNILIREYMGDRAVKLVNLHLLFLNGTAKQRYDYLVATNPSPA